MTITSRLQRISEADLDDLITELRQSGASHLTLFGRRVVFIGNPSQYLEGEWIQGSIVYQLQEAVSDLAQRLSILTELSSLNLCHDQIDDEGAASLSNLTQLTSLNLHNNLIGAAGAASLASLPQLTSLNLSENLIGAAGAAGLAALKKLTSLNLSKCQIGGAGAASLAGLRHLTSLNLSSNQIGAEGLSFLNGLTQLTFLDLSANGIGAAGATSLAGLKQLTSVNLSSNQIGADGLAFLKGLTNLISLNLGYNKIGDVGATYLADLIHHNSLACLNSLYLDGSEIGDAGIASLSAITQLTSLSLMNNQIRNVGVVSLASLTNLLSLNLNHNNITDIRPLAALRNLKSLRLKDEGSVSLSDDCPSLLHPPISIVQQGQEAVLNYLNEIQIQGVDRLYEAKVLILGDVCVGKTSLLRRLYCQDMELPKKDESSKRINIYSHEFLNSEGDLFRLNVWDFGSQEIYHRIHQFFMTKRSLYILVVDSSNSRTTVHDEGFKHWLEVIKALSDRCPVLIFQNEKFDRRNVFNEHEIRVRFPNVMGVYKGNLNDPEAARSLNDAICRNVQHLSHVGDEFPRQWVVIRQKLENLRIKQPYISQSDYFRLYESYLPNDQTKALLLSQYFHDLGIFLHFQDDSLLSQTVILQNDWVTEAVSKLLDDETVQLRNGCFDRESCQRVWAGSIYSGKHAELLALMERFELSYKLRDKQLDTWLFPQLLSLSIPKVFKEWARVDDFVLTYHYDFLPQDMIIRLIARMHRFVLQPDHCWAAGALFERGDTQLLASLASPSGQEIELRARGPERKALLSVISSDLDALNATFEGLRDKVRKLVPCICSCCRQYTNPDRYDEPLLLKYRQDGQRTIQCRKSYETVSVLELLDGLKLEALSAWANPAPKGLPGTEDRPAAAAAGSGSAAPRTIKIFLASSSELREERDAFDLHFRQANDRWLQKGIYLKILRWETFLDAMSETRLQDEYNERVKESDIFVSLFKTKTGKYTEEEFEVAHTAFKNYGKPQIYTYIMQTNITNDKQMRQNLTSLWKFLDKLSDLGHYYTEYTNIKDLLLQFQAQLEQLIEEDKI